MIDIGVNINHDFFLTDLEQTLGEALAAGVQGMICIASDIEESRVLQTLSQNHPALWFTSGCHPHQAKTWDKNSKQRLFQLIKDSPKTIAIGETGLDFNRNYSTPEQQFFAFDEQMALAYECKLPLYLHERDAHKEMLSRLQANRTLAENAVIHCFTGSPEELRHYLDLGLYIGITGWVCDERRGQALQESIPFIPMDRLLLETDSPYLTPRNIRPRPKRNHPKYLPWVAAEVARIKHLDIQEVIQHSITNTSNLFGIVIAE